MSSTLGVCRIVLTLSKVCSAKYAYWTNTFVNVLGNQPHGRAINQKLLGSFTKFQYFHIGTQC